MEKEPVFSDQELQQNNSYTIPLDAFLSPATETSDRYTAPGQWTRENFPKAVTDSFAKSQGSIMAQFAILEWQRLNQGFDYATTFQNYLEANGHHCLSKPAQDAMISAFNRVNQHA